jgi:DNA-binding XRE family transcriptional regulator
MMSSSYAKWSDVKAKGQEADPRTSEEQSAGKAVARERREAFVRGHQLAEMRAAAGLTQAEVADALGVSQARVSKIEHGEISGIEVVRAYVAALGGSVDVVARPAAARRRQATRARPLPRRGAPRGRP